MQSQSAIAAIIICLIVLHRPDGAEVALDTRHIDVIEPIQTRHNYTHGTRSLVHVSGGKVAVNELPHEVEYLIKTCQDGER
jgi:hypothetical protein